MASDTTCPSLLSRVKETGNNSAWREFDEKYGELILRYSRRLGLQHADAEDVRQIVMIRLVDALREFQYSPGRGRFRSFLGRIVSNEVFRYLHRPRAAPTPVDDHAGRVVPLAETQAADEMWEREWMNHHLRLAVRRLRGSYDSRSLDIFEHLLSGQSVQEVASAFNVSPQAVHKLKQRIRDRLKELVSEQIRQEGQIHG